MGVMRGPDGYSEVAFDPAVVRAGSSNSFYQDDPGSLGSGTYAESFPVPQGFLPTMRLDYLACRFDFPFSAGESALIRVFRYRKVAPFAAFQILQITSTITLDIALDWSFTYDFSGNILPGFELDPDSDSLAVSNVYTAGGTPTVRALRVDFSLGPLTS